MKRLPRPGALPQEAVAKVLACWIGHADLKSAAGGEGLGPIGQAVKWRWLFGRLHHR